jgi:lipopolysaccharide transport system ATP-binding protein
VKSRGSEARASSETEEGLPDGAQSPSPHQRAYVANDVAIRVENLSKCYHLYNRPQDRLKQAIYPRMRRLMGMEPKSYARDFWALRDVSFEVKKGETVGVIGRNGSGKSTLLKMICGILNPASGSIQTSGRIAALLELGSGFNPEFTGRENVYMNAAVLGLSNKETDVRFSDIAAFADIGEFIEQPVKTYSSGMMVRLAFAVMAHVDADILIIDEALAVGDAVFVQRCYRFIHTFIEKGTLLLVSHSMQSIVELCNRSIWIKGGEINQDGDAKTVVRHYAAFVHQQLNTDVAVSVISKGHANSVHSGPDKNLDKRREVLNNSNLRFSIQLHENFDFNSAYWGAGGAEIVDVELLDGMGERLRVIEDCGAVKVRVHCRALRDLHRPIVGINIRNQRGIELISENSNLAYVLASPPRINQGGTFYADFKFFLPYLPPGEYTLGAAIADGTHENFVQHQRRDEALRFNVISSHVVYGQFAMPLEECEIVLKDVEL